MATKSSDPHRVIVTKKLEGRKGDTLYVKPFATLTGIRVLGFSVARDVRRTPDLEAWLDREVKPRVKVAS